MSFNLYEGYLVGRERRADAMRDAEHWRLIKSLEGHGSSPGWLHRVGLHLKRQTSVQSRGAVDERRLRTHQTVSNPTV
jgi:hypothetical protein